MKVLNADYVSGAFEWSGFDYKGEPVPNSWPDVNSHFGFLDIAGSVRGRHGDPLELQPLPAVRRSPAPSPPLS